MILKRSFVRKSCPLCNSKNKSIVIYDLGNIQIDLGMPGLILKCTICGMMYKDFSENINEIYDNKYSKESISSDYMDGEYAEKFFNTILSGSKYYNSIINKERIRLLDIGAGTGTLLESASAMGFEVQGVELCKEMAKIGRQKGLHITEGHIKDMKFNREFNVVTMSDIIEHLPSPLSVLKKVKEFLVPGGELIIYTPNHKAPIVSFGKVLKYFRINNLINTLFAGNHVSFFDEQTIISVLDKANFSLRNLSFKCYDCNRPGMSVSLPVLVIISAVENIGCFLGCHGFRMLIYADS